MTDKLQAGANGKDVRRLQQALKNRSFSPGSVDGDFGAGTQQAVLAFQRSQGMLADGVAGPRTQAALGLANDATLPNATAGMSLQVASRMCPDAQLDNIHANLPVLLAALAAHQLADRTMVLVAVATIRAETGSFMPISEGRSRFNTSPGGAAFDLYDHRADLGNQGAPDGARFCGRGFIQLTGRHNYQTYGARLGVDLLAHPELANAADVASKLLCLFLGDR